MQSKFYPAISFTSSPNSGSNIVSDSALERSSLIRNQTIFSLGILLIELCLNVPFEQLRREAQSGDLTTSLGIGPTTDDYHIADLQVQRVYLEAGDDHGYAVQRCLRCEFPRRDVTKTFIFDSFRRDFFAYVVAPVQATFNLLPSSNYLASF